MPAFRLRLALAPGLLAAALALAAVESSPAEAQAHLGPPSVAGIADRLIDAVVNISTSQNVRGPQGVPLPDVPKGSPFEDLFDDFFKQKGDGEGQSERKIASLGSGFVIDGREGIVVTNNHVIEGADEITLNFHDGTKLKVDRIIGRDPKTDLAVLKATPKRPLTEVKFGTVGTLKVGDWVMAIGNPFGLSSSVTLGIISAKQRDINSGPYDDFLQTDAAINKGNSGGPLFNMDGEVVGVNTAIISPSGGSIGIGFAIPSDTVAAVVQQLRTFGEARRSWLGVKIQTVTEEIADSLGVEENKGALVSEASRDGPAAKAGIETGDLILKFDGKDVSNVRSLPRMVAQTPVGKVVDVEILRRGQHLVRKVTLERAKDDVPETGKPVIDQQPGAGPTLSAFGLSLSALTPELRKKFHLDDKTKGLVVVKVEPDGAGNKKGIKLGDVIVEIAQEPVGTLEEASKAIDRVKKAGKAKNILLRVDDAKGELRFVAVPLN